MPAHLEEAKEGRHLRAAGCSGWGLARVQALAGAWTSGRAGPAGELVCRAHELRATLFTTTNHRALPLLLQALLNESTLLNVSAGPRLSKVGVSPQPWAWPRAVMANL